MSGKEGIFGNWGHVGHDNGNIGEEGVERSEKIVEIRVNYSAAMEQFDRILCWDVDKGGLRQIFSRNCQGWIPSEVNSYAGLFDMQICIDEIFPNFGFELFCV